MELQGVTLFYCREDLIRVNYTESIDIIE